MENLYILFLHLLGLYKFSVIEHFLLHIHINIAKFFVILLIKKILFCCAITYIINLIFEK